MTRYINLLFKKKKIYFSDLRNYFAILSPKGPFYKTKCSTSFLDPTPCVNISGLEGQLDPSQVFYPTND